MALIINGLRIGKMSFWKNKPLIITIVLIIVLLVLVIATGNKTEVPGAQGAVGTVVAPIQQGLYNVTSSIGNFFAGLFGSDTTAEEQAALKERVALLESELREYDELKRENERLTELLNVKDKIGDYEYLTARVIGKAPGDWYLRFVVNAGKNDGIEEGMVVITDKGLLGRVVSVTATNCRIMSIGDISSGIPAMVERTRDAAVVKGHAESNSSEEELLSLSYLPSGADIVPGDRIITSGLGGGYPKGLYIGQVAEVGVAEETSVAIKSGVDLAHIEEVVIIKEVFEIVEE